MSTNKYVVSALDTHYDQFEFNRYHQETFYQRAQADRHMEYLHRLGYYERIELCISINVITKRLETEIQRLLHEE